MTDAERRQWDREGPMTARQQILCGAALQLAVASRGGGEQDAAVLLAMARLLLDIAEQS